MKLMDAPLYVRSHDLARWILERVRGWCPEDRAIVGDPLAEEARELALSVGLALTFLRERPVYARDADAAAVRVRELLRLAQDLGLLSASSHRYAQGELLEIGRMVGGWRKRWRTGEVAEKETGQKRRRSRRPRRELEQRSEEVPVRVPEQEGPEEPEQEPGVPRAAPRPSEPESRGHGVAEEPMHRVLEP